MDAGQLMERLRQNPGMVQSLLQSRDGQQLLRMLQGQGDFQQAAQSAARGDTGQMKQMITGLMRSPEGAALTDRIRKAMGN